MYHDTAAASFDSYTTMAGSFDFEAPPPARPLPSRSALLTKGVFLLALLALLLPALAVGTMAAAAGAAALLSIEGLRRMTMQRRALHAQAARISSFRRR